MAVNLANSLYRNGFDSILCTTRQNGPLEEKILPEVKRYCLNKKTTIDLNALYQLHKIIIDRKIDIVHVHGSSVFTAILAKHYPYPKPSLKILWHDHSGVHEQFEYRSFLPHALAAKMVDAIVVVEEHAGELYTRLSGGNSRKVRHLPNFAEFNLTNHEIVLPGIPGKRIVNVATIYPRKDQLTLVKAIGVVLREYSDIHLILVGKIWDNHYYHILLEEIKRSGMERRVTFLGGRNDIGDILKQSDIGVLCSIAEGMPLALLEYGLAGLPVIVTNVGECSKIVGDNETGKLIEAGDIKTLANSILFLLQHPQIGLMMGQNLRKMVLQNYSEAQTIQKLKQIYQEILE